MHRLHRSRRRRDRLTVASAPLLGSRRPWPPTRSPRPTAASRASPTRARPLRSTSASRCSARPAPRRTDQVPMVLHSHGWGGSRTTDPAAFSYLTDAGFGVLSFDQRGFGESGGQAYIENPDVEGKDVQRIVDLVAAQPWVQKQKPGDPVLGAIGGSYGGGYQFVGAFSELRDKGATRFDALVPEITWFSLTQSLFPQGVPRTEWATALTAAALPTDALPPVVLQGFAEARRDRQRAGVPLRLPRQERPGVARAAGPQARRPGALRPGRDRQPLPARPGPEELRPRAHRQGARAQHLPRLQRRPHAALAAARRHQLRHPAGDHRRVLADARQPDLRRPRPALPAAEPDGREDRAHRLRPLPPHHRRPVAASPSRRSRPTPTSSSARSSRTVGAGAPVAYPIAQGPLTIAGSPKLDATLTTLGLDNRAFLALSVGTSPLDARIVQNNMLPIRENGIVDRQAAHGCRAALGRGRRTCRADAVPHRLADLRHVRRASARGWSGAMRMKDVVVHLPVTTR